tara:strand:+ start:516 stop:722 length:207 start_codon:yes stop_codon:yes gene_type:complete
MRGELIVNALKSATSIFKLNKRELRLLTMYDSRVIDRWYRSGNVSIEEAAVWADALGYELILKRKEPS